MSDFRIIETKGIDLFKEENGWINNIFFHLFGGVANEIIKKKYYNSEKAYNYFVEQYSLDQTPYKIRSFKQYINKKRSIPYSIYRPDISVYFNFFYIIKEGFMLGMNNTEVDILYDDNVTKAEIDKLEKELIQFENKKKKKKKANFYMIVKDYDGFDLSKYTVKGVKTDISLHYNDDIKSFDTSVINFLEDDSKSGLILMHGKSGTGKTSYIRYLIRNVKRKFIFIPLFMAEALSNPDLLPFITRHKNSVLIIEDSEKLIANRESGNSISAIATLLNMSDGLLSDALGIKLLCTFNTELSNIDKALLRKGRLISRYEFKELSIEKAKKIAVENNLPYNGKEPISIGDLFNIDTDNNQGAINRKNIGFSIKKDS